MAGGRRGLVAPQNTFLENIVRRSNGKSCLWISVAQAGFDFFLFSKNTSAVIVDASRLVPTDAGASRSSAHYLLKPAGLGGGQGWKGVWCATSPEERFLGDAFGAFSRALPLSSPEELGIW